MQIRFRLRRFAWINSNSLGMFIFGLYHQFLYHFLFLFY